MLKNLIAFAVVFAAMLAPAAPAAAWGQVCMKLPLWKTWFAGHLTVVPVYEPEKGAESLLPSGGYPLYERHVPAPNEIVSRRIQVNQSKCVDIRTIPYGTPFIVYIHVVEGKARLCETHPDNPEQWYVRTDRPYRTLWYEAWGASMHPKCKFVYESN